MKKICFFTPSLGGGGAEKQMAILCNMLADKGYHVTVISYSETPDQYILSDKVNRIRINIKGKRFSKYFSFFLFFLRLDTDCLISFQPSESFMAIPSFFFRPRVKVLVGERNLTSGHLLWFEKINYRLFYRRANCIISNSCSQKNHLYEAYPWLRKKLKVITNYTDIEKFKFLHSPQNEVKRIGVFCRYTPQKNYERFAEAVKILKSLTKQKFMIDWYGKNDTFTRDNKAYFESLIKEYTIDDCLKTHDIANNVSELLPVYDAICLPSLYEGFSNSISEAISCGKVMLVSDVSDNSVMVHNNENGFLFDPLNVQSIADAFLKFFACDKEKVKEMEIKSREIAESLFDKERFVKGYIAEIEK